MTIQLHKLQDYVDQTLETYQLPALSIAVWQDGEIYQAAGGCLNLNTGVEATTDSIFQIGSVTKVMTACLVMKLVEQGRLELDTPVQHYLPDFSLADPKAAAQITVRQLINHSNGIAGDYFPYDRGQEGNLIARFVDRCSYLPMIHPPGEYYSYCNTGFAIAGRLIEVVSGISWYQAMEREIFEPLGMDHAIVDPAEAIRFRTAMGHVYKGERCELAEHTYLSLGMSPVGSVATMRPLDLLYFARAHLDGGRNRQGEPWLSPESVAAMQQQQVASPKFSQIFDKYSGLGWQISQYSSSGTRILGHAGATSGSLAVLQLIPEHNAAIALLTNGFHMGAIKEASLDVLQAVIGEDLREPSPSPADIAPQRLQQLIGDYESLDALIQIKWQDEHHLSARIEAKIDPIPPVDVTLMPLSEHCFAMINPQGEHGGNLAFVDDKSSGVPRYVFSGGRLNERLRS